MRALAVGAGGLVEFPFQRRSADSDAAAELKAGYLVTPASHIGRVVTGVVFVADKGHCDELTAPFSLASISYADKLAEQGYKVLLVSTDQEEEVQDDSDVGYQMDLVEQAVAFLKHKQDIQRVALFGVGRGGDLAIKMAMERPALLDCAIVMCPDGEIAWTPPPKTVEEPPRTLPILLLMGDKHAYSQSDAFQRLRDACAREGERSEAQSLRTRVFVNQDKGFAFSSITEEDAATQAIAEVLDWLVMHLHRFRIAAATSDTDPWWPQGRNGPFFNVGLKTWQDERNAWLTATLPRPPRPPPVPSHLLFDGLSSVRRTYDLPHRMRLSDVIELFVEIWDVQQT